MADDDIALMLAFKGGDYNSFGILAERHQPMLVRFFYAQGLDWDLAEDLAHDVWAKLFRSKSPYVPVASFKTFLLSVARNLWIDQYRSARRKGKAISLDATPGDDSASIGDFIAGPDSEPSTEVHRSELNIRIEEAIASLVPAHREVFILGELQKVKYEEIARILDIPVGTVKSRMFTAVRRLRELLASDQVE